MAKFRILFLTLGLSLAATQAMAHAALVSAVPAAKAVVAPTNNLRLKFSEALSGKLSGVTLTATRMMMKGRMTSMTMKVTGVSAALDPKDDETLVVTLKSPLQQGDYRVDWHAVAQDSHRTTGTYDFTVN